MNRSLVGYLNGSLAPVNELAIPISDYGFTMGVTITEQLRTWSCRDELPLLRWHIDRIQSGLETIGLSIADQEIRKPIDTVVAENEIVLKQGSNLGIGVCVTPGTSPRFPDAHPQRWTVLVYPYVIEMEKDKHWANPGVLLQSVATTEIAATSVPKSIKSRSRLHYFLADAQAREKQPNARPLLFDSEGSVAESSTGSVGIVRDGEIIFPPASMVLDSVSLRFAVAKLGLEFVRRKFRLADCMASDAMLWINAVTGPLKVASVDGQQFEQNEIVDDVRDRWWNNMLQTSPSSVSDSNKPT